MDVRFTNMTVKTRIGYIVSHVIAYNAPRGVDIGHFNSTVIVIQIRFLIDLIQQKKLLQAITQCTYTFTEIKLKKI